LVMACMALERYVENARLFKVLGDCSYSVYLMHVLVLSVGGFVAQRYGVNPYVMFAFCALTIGVASWASYEYVEKCSYRWLKEWIDGESASNAAPSLSRQKY
jgi:exopolysaccharide production protein ExoZ